jgi:hypothetical protein
MLSSVLQSPRTVQVNIAVMRASEWARIVCPPKKREYAWVYHGQQREEDTPAGAPPRTPFHGKHRAGAGGRNGQLIW